MLIGVTGFAGAGKSTSIDYLTDQLSGHQVYVGQYIRDEVERRGLEVTPENEKRIRDEVRQVDGDEAFARRALPQIRQILETSWALIDAIYVKAEWQLYRARFNERAFLFKVDTPQVTRIERLANRQCRSLTADEVRSRDSYELRELRLQEVFDIADATVNNEGPIEALRDQLDALINRWRK